MKPSLRNTVKKAPTFSSLRRTFLSLLLLSCLSPALAGCGRPTYPASQIISAVKKLCRDEYQLDVRARVVGSTLGVAMQIEGLVDSNLKLNKEAGEKIEHMAVSIRRVALSTDKPIDFYVVAARDSKMAGAEFVMTSNVMDVKRASFSDISRAEYLSRLQREFRLNPALLGEDKVRNLFADLNANMPAESALAKYLYSPLSTDQAERIFFPAILIAQPNSLHYQIESIQSKEISDYEALLWVKTKETYTPKPEAQTGGPELFPSGFTNEYLILVNRTSPEKPIMEFLPKFYLEEDTIKQRIIEQTFVREKDLAVLDGEGLPIREVDLKEFLALQIARRLKEKFPTVAIDGASSQGWLSLAINPQKSDKEIFRQALIIAAEIIHGYHLEDFNGLEIFWLEEKKIQVSPQDLEQLRLKKINPEQFFSLR